MRGGVEIKSGPDFEHPNGLDDFGRPLYWGYNLQLILMVRQVLISKEDFHQIQLVEVSACEAGLGSAGCILGVEGRFCSQRFNSCQRFWFW